MSLFDDDDLDDEDERRRAAIVRRARTEGVEAAFESALAICRDPKAAGQARAAAGRTLLQIGGLLDRHDRQASAEKSPDQMTAAELDEAVRRLRREAAARSTETIFD